MRKAKAKKKPIFDSVNTGKNTESISTNWIGRGITRRSDMTNTFASITRGCE